MYTLLAEVTSVTRYPDPVIRWTLTKRAMRLYLACMEEVSSDVRECYAEWLEDSGPVTTNWEYNDRLTEIRDYAFEESKQGGGHNCMEGTNAFLRAFNIGEFDVETTKTVTVAVTIILKVNNLADEVTTQHDVERYLSINVSGNVDDMEDNPEISIDSVDVETED